MSRMVVCHAAMLVASLASPAVAQFAHLSTTDDGKYVYFTSDLVLKGSSPTARQSRLYRLGPDGVSMVAEAPAFGATGRASFGVAAPWTSGDGTIVGFTLRGVCNTPGVWQCGEILTRGSKNQDLGPGTLQVSRNGKWALLSRQDGIPNQRTSTLIDLTTGERTSVPFVMRYGTTDNQILASDGSVISTTSPASISLRYPAGIWKAGKFTPFAPYERGMVVPIALSDDGSTVVFWSGALVARDLPSGRDTVLFVSAVATPGALDERPVVMGSSSNGKRILFRAGAEGEGRAYISDLVSGATRPAPLADGELVTDGALNGSGELAFLVTTAGRLVKITISTGAIETVIPPTAYASNFEFWVFGSLFQMKGSFTGSVADWQNRILVDNRPAPVLALKPGQLDVQIPWSESTGIVPFRIIDSGPSPFEQNELVTPRAVIIVPAVAGAR